MDVTDPLQMGITSPSQIDILPHSSWRFHPWIRTSKPQSPEFLCHSRMQNPLQSQQECCHNLRGLKCWAQDAFCMFPGLVLQLPLLQTQQPLRLPPQPLPCLSAAASSAVSPSHKRHCLTYIPYGPYLPHADISQLLEAALVTAPCPSSILFSSHDVRLLQPKPQIGLFPSRKPQHAEGIPGSPAAGPGLQSPRRLFLVSGYTLTQDRSAGIWSLGTPAARAGSSHQRVSRLG